MNNTVRTLLSLISVVSILMVLPTSSEARILLKEKTQYYSVSGSTGQEIFKSMLEKGPKISGRSGHFLATTEIEYEFPNFTMELVDGKCVPKNADVVVKASYTLPKWRGSGKATSSTRRAWKKFAREVIWHEKEHVSIAVKHAEEMEKVLRTTIGYASLNCSDFSWKLGIKARRVGSKHNRMQKRFDRKDLRRGGRGYKAQADLIRN